MIGSVSLGPYRLHGPAGAAAGSTWLRPETGRVPATHRRRPTAAAAGTNGKVPGITSAGTWPTSEDAWYKVTKPPPPTSGAAPDAAAPGGLSNTPAGGAGAGLASVPVVAVPVDAALAPASTGAAAAAAAGPGAFHIQLQQGAGGGIVGITITTAGGGAASFGADGRPAPISLGGVTSAGAPAPPALGSGNSPAPGDAAAAGAAPKGLSGIQEQLEQLAAGLNGVSDLAAQVEKLRAQVSRLEASSARMAKVVDSIDEATHVALGSVLHPLLSDYTGGPVLLRPSEPPAALSVSRIEGAAAILGASPNVRLLQLPTRDPRDLMTLAHCNGIPGFEVIKFVDGPAAAGAQATEGGARRHLVMADGRLLPVFAGPEGQYIMPDSTVPRGAGHRVLVSRLRMVAECVGEIYVRAENNVGAAATAAGARK